MTGAPRALARRYARALLETAGGEALALRDEMRVLGPAVEGHPELGRALLDPGLGAERRRRLLAAVAERAGASALLRRLLDLLASRDRACLLPDVIEAYAELANAAHGVVSAEVVSAVPLPEAPRRALAKAIGGTVELRSRVDPELVGGLLVRVEGTTYDGSVRTRLAALRRRLASPSPAGSARAS
ncbi:MAG TPA: ATP synthase F1 subunit delta [Vicinamibacteria bacterium]|nr:ATP synthase F1 subunit delta [Vicinamibacteria bacterium]